MAHLLSSQGCGVQRPCVLNLHLFVLGMFVVLILKLKQNPVLFSNFYMTGKMVTGMLYLKSVTVG